MKPRKCCENCDGLNEFGQFKNKLKCLFSCKDYIAEEAKELYDKQKAGKGCSTCKHCAHVRNYPGFITGEECECDAGLKCDTVLFSVKNCPKWVGRMEESDGRES